MIFVQYTETDYEIANSYLSVADADDIINKQNNSDAWQAFDEPTKQMMLMQASLAIDGAMMYAGAKTSSNQILKFPRNETLTLPQNIKFATAMMVLRYSNDEAFKNIKREKISKHETEYFEKNTVDDDVLAFLRPLRANTIKIKTGNTSE